MVSCSLMLTVAFIITLQLTLQLVHCIAAGALHFSWCAAFQLVSCIAAGELHCSSGGHGFLLTHAHSSIHYHTAAHTAAGALHFSWCAAFQLVCCIAAGELHCSWCAALKLVRCIAAQVAIVSCSQ